MVALTESDMASSGTVSAKEKSELETIANILTGANKLIDNLKKKNENENNSSVVTSQKPPLHTPKKGGVEHIDLPPPLEPKITVNPEIFSNLLSKLNLVLDQIDPKAKDRKISELPKVFEENKERVEAGLIPILNKNIDQIVTVCYE